jgi:outer membrane receptor for monomeric catechols
LDVSFAVNPAFAWQISDDSKLNVNFEYVHNDYKPDAGIPLFANEIPDVERIRGWIRTLEAEGA